MWWKSPKLESLTLEYSLNLIMDPNDTLLPSSLTRLSIDYTTLEWLPNLENLENLAELRLNLCAKLKAIQGLGRLKALQTLEISSLRCLNRLDGLVDLMSSCNYKLTNLIIWRCPLLITALDEYCRSESAVVHSLQEMQIDGCPWLDGGSIPRLYKLPRLKVLRIGGVLRFNNDSSGTTMLKGLENLTELVELVLVNLPSVQRLPSLSKLRALRRLIVWDIPNLREIEGLEGLKSLKKLQVCACTFLERLAIADLPSGMEWLTLDIRGCTNFTTDLSTLKLQWSTGKIRWPHEPVPPLHPQPQPVLEFHDHNIGELH